MNKVIFIGNISTDIDMKYTPSGHAVIKFNLAVAHPFKRDETSFVPVEAWRGLAENTAKYCGKGSKIAVDAYVQVDQYEKDGKKQYFTKFVANSIEFLDSKKDGQSSNQSNSQDNDPFKGQQEISSNELPF